MKRVFVLLLTISIFGFSANAFAQCAYHTSTLSKDNSKLFELEAEKLYSNPDLENGFVALYISMATTKVSEKGGWLYRIRISVSSGMGQNGVVPRQIVLNKQKVFRANSKLETQYLPNGKMEICDYFLTETDFEYFKISQISSVVTADPVSDRFIEFQVNSRIISNQVECIKNIIKTN